MPTKNRPPKLGQHFLTRDAVPRFMAEAARLDASDTVLEIGPGRGVLTRILLEQAGRVVAIEKDETLARELVDEKTDNKLTLINQDFRDWWVSDEQQKILGGNYKVVANIPYYLTGTFFRLLFSRHAPPQTIVCLVQKEVATRVVGRPRESLLSISVKAYGQPRLARVVGRAQFSPPPKVDSAVLVIENISRRNFPNRESEEKFFALLRRGFASPRKMLGGKLPEIAPRFTSCGLSPQARAETLNLKQWLCLAGL